MTTILDRTCPAPTLASPERSAGPLAFGPIARVTGADEFVPLADGATVRYANFDYAASAPALVAVQEAVATALTEYASVHRGAGYLSQRSTARYEAARDIVADFIGARGDDHVIFTGNTTDSLNLLAACVPGEVVVLDCEHHANLLPWKRIGARVVSAPLSIEGTLKAVEAELARRPAALLSVTGASNVTGEVLPIRRLAALAHRHGARIAVDGAQLVPHRRISLRDSGVDYLAFSGHKLYAPFGSGVLVGRADWFDEAEPYRCGGGASYEVIGTPVAKSVEVAWHTGPARHEAGSPNVLGAVAIGAACEAIAALGESEIARHEHYLTDLLLGSLTRLDGVRPLRIWADSTDRVGIVAFTVDGYTPREVAEFLSSRYGIGVRDGKFCAHPVVNRLGCYDGAVRASLGLGTAENDVHRLVRALEDLTALPK
ncbi:Cysteine desulfurase OS=Tsukamurella paurometabola (strain ATCC 8368 / DSM / CCUG 35730 / CIP 100753 / JCM 10117 / KCTC 9821 / NBRC 16120 / NCIMB 702349/ NCTC 13040) OX=521096 GN=Tpau_0546 PE=3 SV=1 [Tsukamurella paurometabola]|uniref:Cysteine desulfurase n=1 Tax=Tsukamurella paurometabola (strain ATCC 8368 / DSM 20162 / CCUG 35730 / CIP 100753 / JCM 10117 / KCTC 9821 / NBRC 16120 / NCIMB 702349 / NCTC 13040) TaxID=521096 RepID=D5USB9_TSUPD|nr:aminotransferase class V-fold PLP-dependent enzyme [Tsukamurella paurometabola]ADG77186.1 Cysteine desulfurase [Tsukamurella paurometabola DSM 20162]SUP43094.1 Cysteine desulfurase [Tsukamurella paurometabola]